MRDLANLTQPTTYLRLKDAYQPGCRFACQHIQNPRYIFVLRPKLATLQKTYSQRLRTAASTILNAYELPEQDIALIIERVSNLFSDSYVAFSKDSFLLWHITLPRTSSPHWLCHALTTGLRLSHYQYPTRSHLGFSSSGTLRLYHPPSTKSTHTLSATNSASTVHSSYYDLTAFICY